jgi:hypothetical protein
MAPQAIDSAKPVAVVDSSGSSLVLAGRVEGKNVCGTATGASAPDATTSLVGPAGAPLRGGKGGSSVAAGASGAGAALAEGVAEGEGVAVTDEAGSGAG